MSEKVVAAAAQVAPACIDLPASVEIDKLGEAAAKAKLIEKKLGFISGWGGSGEAELFKG